MSQKTNPWGNSALGWKRHRLSAGASTSLVVGTPSLPCKTGWHQIHTCFYGCWHQRTSMNGTTPSAVQWWIKKEDVIDWYHRVSFSALTLMVGWHKWTLPLSPKILCLQNRWRTTDNGTGTTIQPGFFWKMAIKMEVVVAFMQLIKINGLL